MLPVWLPDGSGLAYQGTTKSIVVKQMTLEGLDAVSAAAAHGVSRSRLIKNPSEVSGVGGFFVVQIPATILQSLTQFHSNSLGHNEKQDSSRLRGCLVQLLQVERHEIEEGMLIALPESAERFQGGR